MPICKKNLFHAQVHIYVLHLIMQVPIFCFKSAEFFFFNRSLTTVIYTHAYKIYETGRTIWSLTLMSWGEQGTWSECPDWRRTSARRNRACSRRVPRGDRESKQSSDWIRFELLIVVVKLFQFLFEIQSKDSWDYMYWDEFFFFILHEKKKQMVKPEFKEYINLPFNKWLLFKIYRYASFVG